MKALVYLGPHQAEVREVPDPEAGPGEAVVRVHAVGVCGTDVAIFAGKHPRATPPLVPGHELYGEVAQINAGGADCDLREGEPVVPYPLLVCGECFACRNGFSHVCRRLGLIGIDRDGGMAEMVRVPIGLLLRTGKPFGPETGTLAEPLAVAVHSVRESGVTPDDSVVVTGGGPIGMLVCIYLRHCGVGKMLVSEVNPFRAGALASLGFRVVNPSEEDLPAAVDELTAGEGAGVLFEASGAAPCAVQMTELVRPRATVAVVSVFKEPPPVDLRAVNFREVRIIGTRVYTRDDFAEALRLVGGDALPLEHLVTHRFPLGQAVEALHTAANPKEALKVMIDCTR